MADFFVLHPYEVKTLKGNSIHTGKGPGQLYESLRDLKKEITLEDGTKEEMTVIEWIFKNVNNSVDKSLLVTGHSLGGNNM